MGEAAAEVLDELAHAGVPCLLCLTFQSFCLQPPHVAFGSICFLSEVDHLLPW